MEEQIKEFNELMVYMTEHIGEWPIEDQLSIVMKQINYMEAIKPIIIKHMAEDNNAKTFLFKL